MHPALYRGPAMVKPPIVYIAGMLRTRRQGVRINWTWISDLAGQRIFSPPNVAGWDEERWMDTATLRGRWIAANAVAEFDALDPEAPYDESEGPNTAVRRALRYGGARRSRRARARRSSATRPPSRAWRPRTGSKALTAPSARTRCGCSWRPPPTFRPADDELQPLRGIRPGEAPSPGRRASGQRAAPGRPRNADPGGHGARPPLVPASLGRGDPLGLRRLSTAPRRPAGGDGAGGGSERAGPGQRLSGRRCRLALDPRAGQRPEIPGVAPAARPVAAGGYPVHRGHAPALESRRSSVRPPASRREALGRPGDRLLGPRPVALHVAPLLRGRGARPEGAHRVDGAPARPDRHPRQPATGAVARRLALAGDGHREGSGGGDRRALLRTRGRRRLGRARAADVPGHRGDRSGGEGRRGDGGKGRRDRR